MGDRQPTKFRAPARAASPLVASKPLLIADARQAMEQVEKAEREKAGDPGCDAAGERRGGAAGQTEGATAASGARATAKKGPGKAPAPGTPIRIAVVPHLTAAAAAIYNSLPVPERDRQRWLAHLVRAGFAEWLKRALADNWKRQQAVDRLREPRRAYVSVGRLTFQTTADRIAALRAAAGDTFMVYPDAAVVGVWVALQLEEELDAQARR